LLFAAVQKNINLVCGEKVLIKSEEIQLTAAEALDYKLKYRKELELRKHPTYTIIAI